MVWHGTQDRYLRFERGRQCARRATNRGQIIALPLVVDSLDEKRSRGLLRPERIFRTPARLGMIRAIERLCQR